MTYFTTLTMNNASEVKEKIEAFLKGKTYSFSSMVAPEKYHCAADVRTGQKMKSVSITRGDEFDWVGVSISDTSGTSCLFSSQKENGYDGNFDAPYIVIEAGQLKITHRAPAGHMLYWTLAIE